MKITKSQLKDIIKEEIESTMDEGFLDIFKGLPATGRTQPLQELQAKKVNRNSLEADGIDPSDYPDYSDAYFSYGEYVDGIEMNDDELNKLGMENPDLLYDTVQEFI